MPITRVKIEGDWIPFCIEELVDTTDLAKTDPSKYHPERYLHRANGRLRIRMRDELDDYRGCSAGQRSWTDGGVRRIERYLNAFVVALHAASASMEKGRVEAERQRQEQEERQRRYEEEQRARMGEQERRKRIGDDIRDWRFARDVRALVAEARRIVESADCEITPGGDIDVWLRWCESHANAVDPLEPLRRAVVERTRDHAASCARCQQQKHGETGTSAPSDASE